jgi:thioredoxin-like negative regulator of GroEL
MATWLRRLLRPERDRARRALTDATRAREAVAARALDEALAEAEEWAAHAVALARVLRETKAAAARLERNRAHDASPRPATRTLH